jgi:hypothetical protein
MKLKERFNFMGKGIIIKSILLFAILSFGTASSVLDQPDQYPYDMAGSSDPYSYMAGQQAQYPDQTPGNAPIPTNPTTPESLGMQTPSAMTSQFSPTAQEKSQGVITSTQQLAYAAAPPSSYATATSPTVIVPTGTYAPNSLYVSYAPQTTTGCYLNANVPLWMKTSGSGNIWFYEWYPNGRLDTNYAGYVYYPGWYKRWFYGDVPGWHILQYYCNGWSNYAYIYVYGSYPQTTYPPTYYSPATQPYPYKYPYPYGQTKWITTYSSNDYHDGPPYDQHGGQQGPWDDQHDGQQGDHQGPLDDQQDGQQDDQQGDHHGSQDDQQDGQQGDHHGSQDDQQDDQQGDHHGSQDDQQDDQQGDHHGSSGDYPNGPQHDHRDDSPNEYTPFGYPSTGHTA